jgi:hypothetical protein
MGQVVFFTIILNFDFYKNYNMHAKKVKTRTNFKIAVHLVDRYLDWVMFNKTTQGKLNKC